MRKLNEWRLLLFIETSISNEKTITANTYNLTFLLNLHLYINKKRHINSIEIEGIQEIIIICIKYFLIFYM